MGLTSIFADKTFQLWVSIVSSNEKNDLVIKGMLHKYHGVSSHITDW